LIFPSRAAPAHASTRLEIITSLIMARMVSVRGDGAIH